ncbi:hypothetical protein [Microcystis sp. M061S2]|uniref:hypothetical protein n=1 Tax=Microcystis sp. M061S2 TaxID=2771171 RepID=UPI00258958E1|nr:hypothetical protein [Microcystis sp. M061S2]MCA2653770.1 hypothetical protein [Microcystis sp. M061S2]
MKIADLIKLTENRLALLNTARADADRAGDVIRIAALDVEIADTTATLSALRALG